MAARLTGVKAHIVLAINKLTPLFTIESLYDRDSRISTLREIAVYRGYTFAVNGVSTSAVIHGELAATPPRQGGDSPLRLGLLGQGCSIPCGLRRPPLCGKGCETTVLRFAVRCRKYDCTSPPEPGDSYLAVMGDGG